MNRVFTVINWINRVCCMGTDHFRNHDIFVAQDILNMEFSSKVKGLENYNKKF